RGEFGAASPTGFSARAGWQIRRELLALKDYYARLAGGSAAPGHEPADPAPGPDELEEWGAFHRQVSELPEEEREVVDLHFYQGLTKAEAAALLGGDVRTVQHRWDTALQRLRRGG